jgi:hypothetical protein
VIRRNQLDEGREKKALDAMEEKAKGLNVKGVAVAMVLSVLSNDDLLPRIRVIDRFERKSDPERLGPNDKGTNYFAVALSKFSEMLTTLTNSGMSQRPLRNGELGYRGGVVQITPNGVFLCAFSGGTENEDTLIADAGMLAMLAE